MRQFEIEKVIKEIQHSITIEGNNYALHKLATMVLRRNFIPNSPHEYKEGAALAQIIMRCHLVPATFYLFETIKQNMDASHAYRLEQEFIEYNKKLNFSLEPTAPVFNVGPAIKLANNFLKEAFIFHNEDSVIDCKSRCAKAISTIVEALRPLDNYPQEKCSLLFSMVQDGGLFSYLPHSDTAAAEPQTKSYFILQIHDLFHNLDFGDEYKAFFDSFLKDKSLIVMPSNQNIKYNNFEPVLAFKRDEREEEYIARAAPHDFAKEEERMERIMPRAHAEHFYDSESRDFKPVRNEVFEEEDLPSPPKSTSPKKKKSGFTPIEDLPVESTLDPSTSSVSQLSTKHASQRTG